MSRKVIIASVCLTLIFLIVFYSSFPAFAFNEQKLLELKPLLSERIIQKERDYENMKIWPALGLGLLGVAIINANLSERIIDDYRLYNTVAGWTFISIGASTYFNKSSFRTDREVLESLTSPGFEREKYAYYLFKEYAERAITNRQNAGFLLITAGLGFTLLPALAKDATSEYKSAVAVLGLVYIGWGLYSYFMPAQEEKEIEDIEKELK